MNAPRTTVAPSTSPVSTYPASVRKQAGESGQNEPSRRPDWLLVMISALFLMTLVIIWLMDVF